MSKAGRSRKERRSEEEVPLLEKTIVINRVAKVVKGGRRFNFSALIVVGDGRGRIGVGHGKANEVPEAVRKATERAKASLMEVPVVDNTVPHTVVGHFGAASVLLRPASPGTGVIAGNTVRAVLDSAGYHNVLTKVLGSNNPFNVVRATLDALQQLESPGQYAARVGRTVEDLLPDYTVGSHVWQQRAANKGH